MKNKNINKITQRQIDIIALMQHGYIMLTGTSDSNGRLYYYVTKGMHNEYFNAGTFSKLLSNDFIYQDYNYPFPYILTKKGKELEIETKIKKNNVDNNKYCKCLHPVIDRNPIAQCIKCGNEIKIN